MEKLRKETFEISPESADKGKTSLYFITNQIMKGTDMSQSLAKRKVEIKP